MHMHIQTPLSSRRYLFGLITLLCIGTVLILHATESLPPIITSSFRSNKYSSTSTRPLLALCDVEDPFEVEYGRGNLRMSRAYEGSHSRINRFIRKMLDGESVTVSAIGGSVTKGHHVEQNEIWFNLFTEWLRTHTNANINSVNGAAPATGSDYFSLCFPLHIPTDSDLVLVELAINDQGIPEHVQNMENLLRGLLSLPNSPAVILVEVVAFSNGGMGGGGGRMHLPVAQYYDVPVINQRLPLVNHFARYPDLVPHYFTVDGWGGPDKRHINQRGHRDLAMLLASLFKDAACQMDVDDVGFESRTWQHDNKDMQGMWMDPSEYGQLPRLEVLEGWNPNLDHFAPPFHPTCLSTRSKDARFNLTPSAMEGWEHWTHPEYLDKPYLIARVPGSRVTFQMETGVGVIKMYSLKSRTFGLGSIECWADNERSRAVRIDGYWDNGENIGRFATIRDDLQAGLHEITCELLSDTKDPGGGTEFRMISMMSV